jgi:hypothetical protein
MGSERSVADRVRQSMKRACVAAEVSVAIEPRRTWASLLQNRIYQFTAWFFPVTGDTAVSIFPAVFSVADLPPRRRCP